MQIHLASHDSTWRQVEPETYSVGLRPRPHGRSPARRASLAGNRTAAVTRLASNAVVARVDQRASISASEHSDQDEEDGNESVEDRHSARDRGRPAERAGWTREPGHGLRNA